MKKFHNLAIATFASHLKDIIGGYIRKYPIITKALPTILTAFSITTTAYAQNPTQGPLQYDPNLRGYGYGVNQPPQSGGYYNVPQIQVITRTLPDQWGAGVTNIEGNLGYSVTYMPSEKAAIQAAMDKCQKENEQCKFLYSFRNQCSAVFFGNFKSGVGFTMHAGFGLREADAELQALKKCQKDKNLKSETCRPVTPPECSYSCHPDEPTCHLIKR